MPSKVLIASALLFATAAAHALPLTVNNYSTLNGNSGSFNYWDESYSPSPSPACTTTDNCALSGGKGDLTDGIIAADNWFVVEAPPGNGPYVGWSLDPTITFNFGSTVTINSVTFFLDDSNGAGGVSAPSAININAGAFSQSFPVAEPLGSAPFSFTATLGSGVAASSLSAQLVRKNAWVFLSEVTFEGPAATQVPEPGTLALLGLAVAALVARRQR